MTRSIAALAVSSAILAAPLAAQACPGAAGEPALARMGDLPIGVTTLSITDKGRPDLAASSQERLARTDRRISVWLWYPAKATQSKPTPYLKTFHHPGSADQTVAIKSCAAPDAAPLKTNAPLIVLSHGYGGWATYLADIAETLASRGYVVAAIDHDDLPVSNMADFAVSFGSAAIHRSDDQRAVIAELTVMATQPSFRLSGAFDPTKLALIGYSMGGFGAMASAGAGYDPTSPIYSRVPGGSLNANAEGARAPISNLKALVLIAPWGAQSENRAWSTQSLAKVTVPTLVLVGDQDDVSGYDDGVLNAYRGMINAKRRLLTFKNARHNLVGADVQGLPQDRFDILERFEEPVWRKDRLRAIARHYIVATLDASLKQDPVAVDYLKTTGDAPPKGFERRWALGFSLTTP